jgi:cytochrome d ubiquinol oxidase subunit II
MLDAGWLAYKTARDVQEFAFRVLPRLLTAVLAFLVLAFILATALELRVMHRWTEEPFLVVFPAVGLLASFGMYRAALRHRVLVPFLCGLLIFAAAFGTLAASFYPYMIPYSITIDQAASPPASLSFLFWGAGVFVFPITLIYTAVVYFLFRGKVDTGAEYH